MVSEARSVTQELSHRHLLPRRRRFAKVFGEGVLHPHFAGLDQHHHGRGGEILTLDCERISILVSVNANKLNSYGERPLRG
jgi:hypothetical protein